MGFGTVKEDVSIGSAMCLESLIGLLAVVESGREPVEANVGVGDEAGLAPLAG
jgi:hypothetical protein